jgi:hypothetical protein
VTRERWEIDAMTRAAIVLGLAITLALGLAAGRFAAQETRPAAAEPARAGATPAEAELSARVAKLQSHVTALTKTVKVIADNQALFARSVMVESNGTVRITGNLRLENNVLDDVTVINCDEGSLSAKRQCTCPEGLIAIGIELRAQQQSAFPGPATYNTALLCSRL